VSQAKDDLYELLVRACQTVGFVTEHTYECLHNAVDSIREDDPEEVGAAADDDDAIEVETVTAKEPSHG
jgi:hypothetical protein